MLRTFAPTVYDSDTAAMDAALGIEGYEIEDFEDLDLMPGLMVEYGNEGPISTLPGLFDPTNPTPVIPDPTAVTWDGQHAMTNVSGNTWVGDAFDQMTFHLSEPVVSFGVGLTGFDLFQARHDLSVNGESLGRISDFPNFEASGTRGHNIRNLYLIIDADPGETLSTIAINVIQLQGGDGLIFDHVATFIPEPGTLGILTIGGLALLRRRLV